MRLDYEIGFFGIAILFALILPYARRKEPQDFYIVERSYYIRVYEEASASTQRGALDSVHYTGFDEFLPAKAFFDLHNNDYMSVSDTRHQEPEHYLWMVPAKSKKSALVRLMADKAYDKVHLAQTPIERTLESRYAWQRAIAEVESQKTPVA